MSTSLKHNIHKDLCFLVPICSTTESSGMLRQKVQECPLSDRKVGNLATQKSGKLGLFTTESSGMFGFCDTKFGNT
jgi:hypothetical protein